MKTSRVIGTKALGRRVAARALGMVGVGVSALALGAGTTHADFQLEAFEAGPQGPEAAVAGGHADIRTTFYGPRDPDFRMFDRPLETPKSVTVNLPAGFAGDPTAQPLCTLPQLSASQCPTDSQVGVAQIVTAPVDDPAQWNARFGVYLLEPPRGETAQFGFSINGIASVIATATVRSGADYGLQVSLRNLSAEALPTTFGASLTLWGVPADPGHDTERTAPGDTVVTGNPIPAGVRPVPFLTNPTRCDGQPLTTSIRVDSWQNPGRYATASRDSSPMTGCENLRFDPSMTFQPEHGRAGEPAAYAVRIDVPQTDDPDVAVTAHVKDVTVRLPDGVVVSPSSADRLQGCADELIKMGSPDATACPPESKIGTVAISTPLLEDPLEGSIYLGRPRSFDAQTGEMLRLFLIAQGSGVRVKLPGNITPDPVTGRLTARFVNNPQLPFDALDLQFQGGPRAPLTNPQVCGTFTTETTITSWAGQTATSTDQMQVTQNAAGGPCAALGFSPAFTAGTLQARAGAFSPFSMTLSREDTDQDLRTVSIDFPNGVLGMISRATLCANSAASSATCPADSRIGGATVASGAGSNPIYLPGDVYITEGYKGAPFGLAIVVRAVAGPFDLGTVVVRTQIQVDRRTAALRVVSDDFPTILQGIPLRLRKINVKVDRPGFMFNPTSCNKSTVGAAIGSTAGASAAASVPFQVGDCRSLPFKPRMSLRVGARGRTTAGKTTPLSVTLGMTPGQANNRVVDVTLPRTLNSRLEVVNLRNSCSPEQFATGRCPKAIGTATAVTPVLRDPLRGTIYLVQTGLRRGLPNMVVALKGQVDIDLTGRITIDRKQRVRTSFDTIPDVPITSFRLDLIPGRNGAVGIVRNLCTKAGRRATVAMLGFRAQSGKYVGRDQRISVAGCKRAPAARGRRSRGRRGSKGKGRRSAPAKSRK